MNRRWPVLGLLLLAGCAPVLQDPPEDITKATAPVMLKEDPPPARPPVIPGPQGGADVIKAWVPTRTLATGEVIDGHWELIPRKATVVEAVEPAKIVPRAGRLQSYRPQPVKETPKAKEPTKPAPVPGVLPGDPSLYLAPQPTPGGH